MVRAGIFHSTFKWKHWVGFILTFFAYIVPYQQLASMAKPAYTDDGDLLDGGFDMSTGGICGYVSLSYTIFFFSLSTLFMYSCLNLSVILVLDVIVGLYSKIKHRCMLICTMKLLGWAISCVNWFQLGLGSVGCRCVFKRQTLLVTTVKFWHIALEWHVFKSWSWVRATSWKLIDTACYTFLLGYMLQLVRIVLEMKSNGVKISIILPCRIHMNG